MGIKMNMKTITLFASILIMAIFSSNALATSSHLDQAIDHAQAAVKSTDGDAVAQHAGMSKQHANAAKSDNDRIINRAHLDQGIDSLNVAVSEGKEGNTEAAREAATDAIQHFEHATLHTNPVR